MRFLERFLGAFVGRPTNHRDPKRQGGAAAAAAPVDAFFCAVRCRYLPHGGSDDLWLELTASERNVRRVRSFYTRTKEEICVTRSFTDEEAAGIRDALDDLGVWSLPPCQHLTYDGWVCAVAVARGARLHFIPMHNPNGQHVDLLLYLFKLAPLPEQQSEGR